MSNFCKSLQIYLKTGCLLFLTAAQAVAPRAFNVEMTAEQISWTLEEVLPSFTRGGFRAEADFRRRAEAWNEAGWSVFAGYLFPDRTCFGAYLTADIGVAYRLDSGLQLKIRVGAGYFLGETARNDLPSVPLP